MKRKARTSSPPPEITLASLHLSDNPAVILDDAGDILAAKFNDFDLSSTLEFALTAAEAEGFVMMDEERDPLVFDISHHSTSVNSIPINQSQQGSNPSQNVPAEDANGRSEGDKTTKKKRKKRAKSDLQKQESLRALNLRGGVGRQGGRADEEEAQLVRQLVRNLRHSGVFTASEFSMMEDASVASTHWQGRQMPAAKLRKWRADYSSGAIKETVATFVPVHFTGKPAMLVDKDGRLFAYRTEIIRFLNDSEAEKEFFEAIQKLLGKTLSDEKIRKLWQDAIRGDHFPCIIGHMRQYTEIPALTLFHQQNREIVIEFMQNDLIRRSTELVNRTLRVMFPGVAARYEWSKKWHKDTYGIEPLFGLYWCLCVNGMFTGQQIIHCKPHIDFKNVVGVCALLVYQVPGKKFDHARRCWLVLWEAGVAIQLPPWTVLLYPSSLLHHFNIDIADFEFVTTDQSVEWPTKDNSTPIDACDGSGRGSFVWFNQASQFNNAETGYASLKKARKAGLSGKADYGQDASKAFPIYGKAVEVTPDY